MTTYDNQITIETGAGGEETAVSNVAYFGLSTDNKPASGVGNGSAFIEMNTGKLYFFDAEGAQWIEWEG